MLTPPAVVDAVSEVHRRVSLIGLATPVGIADLRRDLARWLRGAGPAPGAWGALPTVPEDLAVLVRRAREVVDRHPASFPLRGAVLEDLTHRQALLDACDSRDAARFSAYSRAVHGAPDAATVAHARALLDEPVTEPAPRTATAADLAAAVTAALQAYGLDDWSIEFVPQHGSRISVNRARKRVRIQSDAVFSAVEVARLVVHEVGGHVLRSHNADRQREPLAVVPLGATVATEEGIAAWLEHWAGIDDPQVMRTYAARVLAVELSAQAGILDVAKELSRVVGADAAAAIATRAKRGLRDPMAPGGLTKDHAYLSGFLDVQRLVGSVGDEVLPLLLATKWPMSTLALIRQLVDARALQPAEDLPDTAKLGVATLVGHRTLARTTDPCEPR